MNAVEVKEDVGCLAMENGAEVEDGPFWSAVNRAAEQINRLRPVKKTVDLYNRTPHVIKEISRPQDFGYGQSLSIKADLCAAFMLRIAGGGDVTVYKDDVQISKTHIEDNGKINDHRVVSAGYGKGEQINIEVVLSGDYKSTLVSAAFYSEKLSDDPDDIPDVNIYNVFNLKTLAPDYLQAENILYMGEDDGGAYNLKNSRDFVLWNGSELWLLRSKPGFYRVVYRPRLSYISENNGSEELEIDPALHSLVPLLVCYYVWLEDKPEVAQAMYAQYIQMAAEIRNESRPPAYPAMQDVYNGW